ncbi:MAG: hypothetical protein GXO76_08045 [Calditrichaeota bacterium]|nr:hypothetical protein [Calditrichota bacterium]
MKTTRTSFTFPEYASRRDWETRAEVLRRQILVAAGLWPFPPKTPLHARIFGRIEHSGYSVEKVTFESYPRFFVTGNLYRPRGQSGPFPAILTPHGHWAHGRLENSERVSVPGRCINLARQGYVVFSTDMVGYCDSKQISHKFAGDSLSQVFGISLLGLQLWNSIRSLDFLESLPDVDAKRIGCTGASGGGTQTFLLTAVDPRVKVAAPVNMVSADFQGGCLCENAPGLRIDAFNVEFAALAAPRPLLLVSNTHDWTKNTPWVEYPMLKKIYDLYDAGDRLKAVQFDFPHNYNKPSREAVYAWFGKWLLGIDDSKRLKETPFQADSGEALRIFLKKEPPGKLTEETLKTELRQMSDRMIQQYWPKDRPGLSRFRTSYGEAFRTVVAARRPAKIIIRPVGEWRRENAQLQTLLIAREGKHDWIPAVWVKPALPSGSAVLVISGRGKKCLFQADSGKLAVWVQALLSKGESLLAIDPFGIGEHVLPKGTQTARNKRVKFFTTFNRTDVQEQVQDALTALEALERLSGSDTLSLLGLGKGGPAALLAGALTQNLQKIIIDGSVFRGRKPEVLLRYFVPGLGRIGGFTLAAALSAPQPLQVFTGLDSTNLEFEPVLQVYKLFNRGQVVQFHKKTLTRGQIKNLF